MGLAPPMAIKRGSPREALTPVPREKCLSCLAAAQPTWNCLFKGNICRRDKKSKNSCRLYLTNPLSLTMTRVLALKAQLWSRKKAVYITGAGISVNAGGEHPRPMSVPSVIDLISSGFWTIRKSDRSSFDISVYNSSGATERFCNIVRNIWM